jgi:sec-independent protein translocase protein TatC
MTRLPFWDHVEELRKIVVRSGWVVLFFTLLAFCFHKQIFSALLAPLAIEGLYFLNPIEGFSIAAKLSLWVGITLSSPFWLYFILTFFLPALKPRERRLLFPFLLLSLLFAVGGILFAYTITLPLVMQFFQKFNSELGENLWSAAKTFDLILGLILAHGIVFELYVVLLLLIRFRLLSYSLLKKVRRGVIVAIFVLAALLTPPDVLSQLLLAFPMLLLFESAILYARLITR